MTVEYSGLFGLPMIQTKHRVFASFHHKDQVWRDLWDGITRTIAVNVSVGDGEIDDSSSAGYIKRLIQLEYITQASVVVVLIGPRAYCRKHIDWEISAGINAKVGGRSGLLGILLPNHPDFGKPNYSYANVPPRLADNVQSGYAIVYDWTSDVAALKTRIELAFRNRVALSDRADNSRLQLAQNVCD